MKEALMAQGINAALGAIQNLINQAKPEAVKGKSDE